MIGIEFVEEGKAFEVSDALRENHILTLVSGTQGKVLALTPPLTIGKEDLKVFIEMLSKILQAF